MAVPGGTRICNEEEPDRLEVQELLHIDPRRLARRSRTTAGIASMDTPLNLLHIEDSPSDFLLVEQNLQENGLDVRCRQVDTISDLRAQLGRANWDAVLSDYSVPGMDFKENLKLVRSVLPDVPVILVSGTIGEERAVELLKLNVTDFVLKDNLTRLVPAIERALHDTEELHAKHAAEQSLHEKDELLREMSALAHIGGWEFNPATGKCFWTEEVARIHEVDPSADISIALGLSFFEPEGRRKMESALGEAIASGKRYDLELEIVTAKGNRKWVRTVGVPISDGERVIKLRGAIQDITERKRGEIMLFEQKERAEVTLHSIGDAVITTEAQGNIDYLNPMAEQLTGWSMPEALGKPLMKVLNIVDEKTELPLPNPILPVLATGKINHLPADCLLIRRDLKRAVIEDSAAPIRGRDGRLIGAVLVFRDVTATREITAQIAYRTTHDVLTGLPNRILAWDRLEQAIGAAQREGSCVGILFLGVDRFKNVNDSLGYAIGDYLLEQVGLRLQSVTRAIDTVSRQGGDEFMVIMPNAGNYAQFGDLAKKILAIVSTPYFVKQQELSVTFSIGISVYPHDGSDVGTLIRNADAAMCHAKEAGRNNYQFYATEMNNKAAERLSLEGYLRHAVARQEFVVYYQPKVDIANRKLIGAEALIRWNHPFAGLLNPSNFIGIAEDSGLIVPIGQWVLEEVCRQNQAWLQDGLACVPISVNLSAIQFRNKSLVESLKILLDESGLPPELLELELTESFIMQGSETVIGILQKLKGLGLNLSIDDFGTGYSSLSYLKRFPIDTLKIDQSFVRDIAHDDNDAAIIKAIISMAHSLKIRVIAEGVETQEQLAFLEAHQCDEIQGYYFSQPVPAMKFEEMLKVGGWGAAAH
jgi:diguanylate cyclase (GGDEF)-like protein/PAS domain S-box-containing protein